MRTIVLWLALMGVSHSVLADDPDLEWFTLTTPHFWVHYYRNSRGDENEVAQYVAHAAEKAHRVLVPLLDHVPSGRTHIVVTDDSDSANGFAEIVPRNAIRIFAVGPDNRSALSDYDDWLYTLVVHEYVHVLHIDTIGGLPRWVNRIFGKVWAPNQIQPRWFIEGLAVFHESARTTGGRVRNTLFDMMLRASVDEGSLLELDRISSTTRMFPRHDIPYLYGGRFLDYLANRFGERALTAIGNYYGGSALPYGLNVAARQTVKHDFVALYRDFLMETRRKYREQLDAIRRQGETRSVALTHSGEQSASTRLSRDGQELVFIESDGHRESAFVVMDVASGKTVERIRSFGSSVVELSPDRRYLIYDELRTWKTFYSYRDLYLYDRTFKTTRRVTQGMRAREPSISPDQSWIAFVSTELGRESLYVVPFQGGAPQRIFQTELGEQIFTPRWHPVENKLVVSMSKRGYHRDIYEVDLPKRTTTPLFHDRAMDLDPVYASDGQSILFSSDRTGVFNLYRYEVPTKRLTQLTNVRGGLFSPTINERRGELYFIGYSAAGFDVHRIKGVLSTVRQWPILFETTSIGNWVDARLPWTRTPYRPWRTLLPQSWMLSFGTDALGSSLGIDVEGSDIVGLHRYSLLTRVSMTEGQPSYALTYTYNGWWPSIDLIHGRFVGRRGDFFLDGVQQPYLEENWNGGIETRLPLVRRPLHSLTVNLGYRANLFTQLNPPSILVRPGELSPRIPLQGVLAGVSLSVTYSNVERFLWSVSAERGRQIQLNVRVDHELFGSDLSSVQLSGSWQEYLAIPWPKSWRWFEHHVMALSLNGGVARGDLRRRGAFSLGGFPGQNLIQAVIELSPLGGTFLRGYPQGAFGGTHFYVLNCEYRFPLIEIERGLSTLPIFVNHVHAAFFSDFGNASSNRVSLDEIKIGLGGELLLEWSIGYIQSLTLRVGYAYGLMDKGGHEVHVIVGNRF